MLSPSAKLLLSQHSELCEQITYEFMSHTLKPYKNENEWTDFVQSHSEPKRDWEIVALTRNGNCIVPDINKKIRYADFSDCTIEDAIENRHFKIYQVKRLSDEVTFMVGDCVDTVEVNSGNPIKNLTIREFKVFPQGMSVGFILGSGVTLNWCSINAIKKSKPVLFKTEDGVDVYDGDVNWFVTVLSCKDANTYCHEKMWDTGNAIADKNVSLTGNYKWFSTKEAAESYVLFNRSCLSLRDIENVAKKNHLLGTGGIYVSQPDIIELAKQKSAK